MSKLGRITFVALDGDAPADRVLDRLPASAPVLHVVQRTFEPFLVDDGDIQIWDGQTMLVCPPVGLHLVYVYGHAWLTPGGSEVAWRVQTSTVVGSAATLLNRLLPVSGAKEILLVLDCCHAASFDACIEAGRTPRMIVYACDEDEKAIAFVREQASRLSLALAVEIARARHGLDFARVVANVADQLNEDGVIRGQTVTYRMHGLAVRLVKGSSSAQRQRERTVARVRNTLIGAGAVFAVAISTLGWFYWSHALVEVDLAGLPSVANNVRLTVYEDDPTTNSRTVIDARQAGQSTRIRVFAPASNLVLHVDGDYTDGAERSLRFHLLLESSFTLRRKWLALVIPPAAEVLAHPNMAFVPTTAWFHGREREPRTGLHAYWIDLRPPTMDQYEVAANHMLASGQLKEENSFTLSWRQRTTAIDAVDLEQLRPLSDALGEIFGIIEAANTQNVSAPGDIVVGTGELPCAECPAPLTRLEAGLYCASRGMRIPTDLEWELAVRGVDGRVYPWGNRFDETRANVPGLPDKGETSPQLKPVNAYASERSPFGLIDTVGNAGDWVTNESGAYERVYMGATYQYNPEDATAFRMLPVTEVDSLVREITTRCVADAGR